MRIIIIIVSLLCTLSVDAKVQQRTKQKKILVTYFSVPERDAVDGSTGASRIVTNGEIQGTTEYVARIIANATGANLFQIKTTHSYPATHKELIDYAKMEGEAKTYPKIASKIANFKDYDVIFVGYPNWWYDMPMVIYSLFNDYDFTGKTIVAFCTHGGSGFSQSVQTIKQLEKGATVINIPALSRNNVANSRNGIIKWLTKNGFTK